MTPMMSRRVACGDVPSCRVRCQVIVKLSNIVLTPEQPEYKGGEWRVEGVHNEHIVAVGVYYYDATNISEARMHFRQPVDMPEYDISDDDAVYANLTQYGLEEPECELNQLLGTVAAKSDRCIAIPNAFHHCVEPFRLRDPSRGGSIRSLVFFLVDPLFRSASTADVPPQQPRWLEREMLSSVPGLQCLPEVLVREVMAYVGGITSAQARTQREALQTEHRTIVSSVIERVASEFSWWS